MSVSELCVKAKKASYILARESDISRREAVLAMSGALLRGRDMILAANAGDVAAAREKGMPAHMIDRLSLDEKRVAAIAEGMASVAALPDPLGVISRDVRPNGLVITKTSVPFGLVAIIFEARPNVAADAAAICIRSGNAVVLRGGSDAINSNLAVGSLLSEALSSRGIPGECVSVVPDTGRESASELMRMNGVVDLLIPRGGRSLISSVVAEATVPIIETGAGNCHIYFDVSADVKTALDVLDNAKRSRPSVCNAAESLLVCRSRAQELLPLVRERMPDVELRCYGEAQSILPGCPKADESDLYAEYNDLVLSVAVVGDVREAVEHINSHGTHHSDCIVTRDRESADYFLANIDSACVYVNASTRFTDGGEFGFGAEIGISTQKLHARGPMGLRELTTYKYLVSGDGQTR